MKGKKTKVTDEDISKAYEALGLDVSPTDIEKGEGCDANGVETEKEPIKKAKSKTKAEDETDDVGDDGTEEEDDEEEDDVEEAKKVKMKKGGDGVNRFDRIEKAIATSHQINSKYIKALGVMVKDVAQKATAIMGENSELKELVKAQEDTISVMSEKLEAFGSEVPAPKSLSAARPVERQFAKADDNDTTKGGQGKAKGNQVSMSKQPHVVAEILDQATFAKGFDDEFSKACTAFEANKALPANIIARIKNETGIEIVK